MSDAAINITAGVDACWSRIGVRGDKSCPQLERHIHCRNCPTYSTAATAVLDGRSPDGGYVSSDGQLRSYAAPSDVRMHSVMAFRLGAELFGLPVLSCREVVAARPIHSLPHRRRDAVLGLANVRGTLLICISLSVILHSRRIGDSTQPRQGSISTTARLLVLESETGPVAAPVDEVRGVLRYHPKDLKSVPATSAKSQGCHTRSVLMLEQLTVGVLDANLLSHSIARTLT